MKSFSIILAVSLLTGLTADAQEIAQTLQQAENQVANMDTYAIKPLSLEEKLAAKKAAVHAKMMAKKAELGVKPETDALYEDKMGTASEKIKEDTALNAPTIADATIDAPKEKNVEIISETANSVNNIADNIKNGIATNVNEQKDAVNEIVDATVENVNEQKDAVNEVVDATVENVNEQKDDTASIINENKENIVDAVNEIKQDVQQTNSDLDNLEEMLGE
ncbi:MAG: hypothetical protein IJ677_02790 [Alphaproteobacteria bacterium]|nr:hypothetical protein [Alphaproteobacteria bacterium]